MDVLAEGAWQNCYNLTLELYLERAECEILSSNLELAALLIEELLREGRSKTDRAEACRLRMLLELKRGDYAPAVRTALECLRMFNLELPERPTPEQVRAEYDEVRRALGERSIASLVDLPLMADPEVRAVMKLFSALGEVAYHTDSELFQMITCCMVKLTLRHGTTEFSTIALRFAGHRPRTSFPSFQRRRGLCSVGSRGVQAAWIHGPEGRRALPDANGRSVDAPH
jgi:predicted ATPase